MRKLIMWNVITLDGYFEGKKPWDLDFHNLVWGEELEQFSLEQLKSADTIIYGERTYRGMAQYWSQETGDIADYLNKIQKIVCSKTVKSADWENTRVVHDAEAEIAKLKQDAGGGDMFVFGSAVLSHALMKAGLFDEYRLCIAPVLLGQGRKLFAEGVPYQKLTLLKETTLATGGVLVQYAAT